MQHINLCPVKGITTTAPSTTNHASKAYPVVVTSFEVSGTSWKRVYSDGWIEMGGYVAPVSITGYSKIDITFPWEFNSAPLFIKCTPVSASTTNGDFALYGVIDVSATGFSYQRGAPNTYTVGFYWIAKGMGTTQEPEPSSDAYVEGDTLYAGSDVTNNT